MIKKNEAELTLSTVEFSKKNNLTRHQSIGGARHGRIIMPDGGPGAWKVGGRWVYRYHACYVFSPNLGGRRPGAGRPVGSLGRRKKLPDYLPGMAKLSQKQLK